MCDLLSKSLTSLHNSVLEIFAINKQQNNNVIVITNTPWISLFMESKNILVLFPCHIEMSHGCLFT